MLDISPDTGFDDILPPRRIILSTQPFRPANFFLIHFQSPTLDGHWVFADCITSSVDVFNRLAPALVVQVAVDDSCRAHTCSNRHA